MRENTGPALAIAGVLTFGYVVWASVIVVLMWLALTVYAIVQWIGGDQHADPTIVLLIMVANITLFLLLLYGGVYFIGRSMQHKKRDGTEKDDDLAAALDSPANTAEARETA